jgi:hypothetical protein
LVSGKEWNLINWALWQPDDWPKDPTGEQDHLIMANTGGPDESGEWIWIVGCRRKLKKT